MKRYVVIILAIVVLFIVARKPVQQTIETYQRGQTAIETVSSALDQADRAMSLYGFVQSKLEVSEKGFDDLQKQLQKEQAIVSRFKAEISDLKQKQYDHVPDTVFVYHGQPETLDSALIIIEQQHGIIDYQFSQIQVLQDRNINQALIIEKQDIVIEFQDNYINEFETSRGQYRRRSSRNIGISFIAGYIAGKLL